MVKLWWLVRYFVKYRNPSISSIEEWFGGEINRHEFVEYLVFQKKFRENWIDTLKRWDACYLRKKPRISEMGSTGRARLQRQEINDILNDAMVRVREYIFVARTMSSSPHRAPPTETFLSTDFRGRQFCKNPFVFFNAVLKEYGYLVAFLFGTGGTLIFVFWGKIIDFIVSVI